MTTGLACLYAIVIAVFSFVVLLEWVKNRKAVSRFVRFGLYAGLVVVGLDLVALIVAAPFALAGLLVGLVADAIVLVRIIGFASLGLHYCREMGHPGAPFLLQFAPPRAFADRPVAAAMTETATDDSSPDSIEANAAERDVVNDLEALDTPEHARDVEDESIQAGSTPQTPDNEPDTAGDGVPQAQSENSPDVRWDPRGAWAGLAVAALAVAYSVVLFWVTRPHLSLSTQQMLDGAGIEQVSVTVSAVLLVVEVAIAEEIFFRLGIQSGIARWFTLPKDRYWMAIFLTALLWTLGHIGALDPDWVKLVQVFPLGLMLGWLFRKYGLEASLVAHVVFNVIMVFAAGWLVQ